MKKGRQNKSKPLLPCWKPEEVFLLLRTPPRTWTMLAELAIQTSKEKQERDKSQTEFELRILRNHERRISKAYRSRTDNATLVQNILMAGTFTAGRTSCCDKCREMGIDPYGYEVKEGNNGRG